MVLQLLMVWLHNMRLLIALPGGNGAPRVWQRGTTGSAARDLQTCALETCYGLYSWDVGS
jgi:hypothetical protein